MSHQQRRHPATRSREQGGYVLPMFAIMLTVLMAMAGFGVDVWNWWYNAQRIQRAADSGSLAGVIYMPGDETTARSTAISVVASNGYPASAVTAGVGDRPNRLRVQVSEQVPNNFVSLLGIRTTTITRDATAEYSGVVETGSPINQMGNQPGSTDWPAVAGADANALNPQIWAQIAGPGNFKGNGDRYTSSNCDTSNFACNGGVNSEYDSAGYFYTVRINATAADVSNGYLLIDVYDAAFVQSGDNCTEFRSADDVALRNTLAGLGARYDSNTAANNNEYCTGDHRIQDVTYGSGFPTVQFRTAKPDATPWNVRDNFAAGTVSACDGTDATHGAYPAVINQLRPYGTSGSESAANFGTDITAGTPANPSYLRAVYHQYVRVCAVSLATLGVTAAGEYDVSFNSRISGTGSGHNRYAIRAGLATSPTAANGAMPLYQNATSSTATFYLARVLPGAAGRRLNLQFFDVGDGSGSGTITIVPPDEAKVNGNDLDVFGSLAGTADDCTATLTSASTPDITGSACRLNNVSSANGYNGHQVEVTVPIDDNYTCGSVVGGNRVISATDCWVRVRFNWSSGVQDTTTWRATIVGDPVRLTE
jgi:Flp pilus assembly protein TadG